MRLALVTALLLFSSLAQAIHQGWVTVEYPQDKADEKKLWWDEAWWDQGKLSKPDNYEVVQTEVTIKSGDVEVNALVFRPKAKGKFPAVLFQHGRRGIDDLTKLHPLRLAARGFVVLAPDVFSARFIEKYPIEHDYEIENDSAAAIDYLLSRKDISTKKICTVSHTRGGYITLKALVTKGKQSQVACYVAYYPHWQDPNAAEPMQVYRYAPEVDKLEIPVMVYFGEHDQYQRQRPIMMGIESLREKGRDAHLIIYPGVGRGFDFRPPTVRTFADDLAAKDAMQRTADFIKKHLKVK
ncbi:MAG: dienelactone hydrolase family protein [Gammaproteobacteria bacterium]|nr:dienelactone hydrolase family protein [Gammaproteobacteria bacterium]MDH5801373.1 dienelactone hydrolase family protein [Gammaproteobacteria bacterium]